MLTRIRPRAPPNQVGTYLDTRLASAGCWLTRKMTPLDSPKPRGAVRSFGGRGEKSYRQRYRDGFWIAIFAYLFHCGPQNDSVDCSKYYVRYSLLIPPTTTMSNQLNAGAASFTPGGPPAAAMASMQESYTEASFNEFADMVDTIEQEMEAEEDDEDLVPPEHYSQPATVSGLPAHMVKHANEFWFPESRDCSCCKGFKHGCQCAPSHGGVCASCVSSAPPPTHQMTSLQAAAPPPRAQQQQQQHQPHYNSGGGGGGGPRQHQQQQICKFFRSPGGCRFGDNCRFLHA